MALKDLPIKIIKKYQIDDFQVFKDGEIIIFRTNKNNWGVVSKFFSADKNKWGVLSKTQTNDYKLILKPIYDAPISYIKVKNILCVIKTDYTRFKVINGQAHSYYKRGQNHYFLFDTSGQLISKFLKIDTLIFNKFGHVIIIKNSKYGLLDDDYNSSISCRYDKLEAISNDLFLANNRENDIIFNGLVDDKNKVIAEFGYNSEIYKYVYLNQIIIHEDNRHLGIPIQYYAFHLDTIQKKPLPFEEIIPAYEGYNYDKAIEIPKYRTITNIKEDIPPIQTDWVSITHAIGKWGLIYPNGDIIIPNMYDYLEKISLNYFLVAKGEVIFSYDEDRNELIAENLKWGIIDENNSIILELKYDWVKMIDEQNICVNTGGILICDFKQHKPHWDSMGGTNRMIKLESKSR